MRRVAQLSRSAVAHRACGLMLLATVAAPGALFAQSVMPSAPDIHLSSRIVADPLGSQRPKALPGALVEYELQVSNFDTRLLDHGGFAITSPVPRQLMLLIANPASPDLSPFQFEKRSDATVCRVGDMGIAGSCLQFSSNGGASFDYVPNPGTDGVDSRITHVRFRISGTDAPGEVTAFILRYRMIME